MKDLDSVRRFLAEGPEEERPARRGDRLGELAVGWGYLTEEQLEAALAEQRAAGGRLPLGEILRRKRWLTSEQLLRLLVSQRRPPRPRLWARIVRWFRRA
ncbi:MAG TPA: hypothetical protein VNO22_13525 [Planctomycetota bacterium]|jgi:hypothetical protein|nr:hypothetical protein [Planctomycetota bacterium]